VGVKLRNGLTESHEVIEKIGRGKYSDVYKCIDTVTNKYAVVKVLKPGTCVAVIVRENKIKREIKILRTLDGTPGIIGLTGVTYDRCSNVYSLVHPLINHIDIRDIPDRDLSLPRIRNYIFQVLQVTRLQLQALRSAHKAGIMHRDIKPQNVLYDQKTEEVFVADWGLADFYVPHQEYNLRVASRFYKGPELLLSNKMYGCSLDIWSLGCIFGGLVAPLLCRSSNGPSSSAGRATPTNCELLWSTWARRRSSSTSKSTG
jgi:casein kinase II subunit alpha